MQTLVEGLVHEAVHTVTRAMSPSHLPMIVLSTPMMIGFIERTCHKLVQPHLSASETTVGTHVDVSHDAPAKEGEEIRIKATLASIVGRRLTFEVEVHASAGLISLGKHERAVVDISRFG